MSVSSLHRECSRNMYGALALFHSPRFWVNNFWHAIDKFGYILKTNMGYLIPYNVAPTCWLRDRNLLKSKNVTDWNPLSKKFFYSLLFHITQTDLDFKNFEFYFEFNFVFIWVYPSFHEEHGSTTAHQKPSICEFHSGNLLPKRRKLCYRPETCWD